MTQACVLVRLGYEGLRQRGQGLAGAFMKIDGLLVQLCESPRQTVRKCTDSSARLEKIAQ